MINASGLTEGNFYKVRNAQRCWR